MKFWLIVVLTIAGLTYVAIESEDKLALAITSNLKTMQGHKQSSFAYVTAENNSMSDYEDVAQYKTPNGVKKQSMHSVKNIALIKKEAVELVKKRQLMEIEKKAEREKRAWEMLDAVIASIPHNEDRCKKGQTLLSLRAAASKKDKKISLALAKQWISYVQKEYCQPIYHTLKDMDFSPKYLPIVNG
jgi:chromatin segregation and condensation protein Rec8/ScpA/Scc1 (kleisin family)